MIHVLSSSVVLARLQRVVRTLGLGDGDGDGCGAVVLLCSAESAFSIPDLSLDHIVSKFCDPEGRSRAALGFTTVVCRHCRGAEFLFCLGGAAAVEREDGAAIERKGEEFVKRLSRHVATAAHTAAAAAAAPPITASLQLVMTSFFPVVDAAVAAAQARGVAQAADEARPPGSVHQGEK